MIRTTIKTWKNDLHVKQNLSAPSGGMQKLRVLCLHGYTQNGTVFSNRIGSTRKFLKNHCEFIFIDAPYLVEGNEAQKSWWITSGSKCVIRIAS